MSLKEYRAKRNFRSTREPAGQARTTAETALPRFVVQKHAASRLHYDFRLEINGVLKSWAVPKGFPTARGERRLAVQVEDHPLEYQDFEGTIPEGNYGAGTVMVWDKGTYQVYGDKPEKALEAGKIHLQLNGQKLKGEWTLVQLKKKDEPQTSLWLLLKSGEDARPISRGAEDHSALSGRSLAQIAAANDRQWGSDREAHAARRGPRESSSERLLGAEFTARSRRLASEGRARANKPAARAARSAGRSELGRALSAAKIDIRRLPKAKPRFIEPMKALLVKELPRGPEWIYEIKFDGVRALAIGDNGTMSLRSRADKDLAAKYTPVVKALEPLQPADVVLDGEVVAVDARGRSAFQLLQSYQTAAGPKPPIFYYVFDILNLDGRDLTGLPLWQRKRIARDVVKALGPVVRFSDSIKAESVRVVKEMQRRGLEGLMAKQIDSEYQPGQRTGGWVKFKWTHEQEFVIGGYTEPQGARAYFGAILVGYYQGGKLLYAGKVGTGFDQKTLTSLYEEFQKLRQDKCPFANLPEPEGLTAAQMRRCTWLKPELVCQVRFSEWTRDGHLRQPAYLGLREDKVAREVSREVPQ